ncbi:something about silencing protein 10, partial [Coemansia spiralis]
MARRQKGRSGKAAAPAADEDELVRRGASVKAIRTWDDAEHESADEFEAGKDRVLVGFDRRQRQGRGAGSGDDGAAGESDEEVLGVRAAASSGDDSDNDAGEAFYSDEDDEGPGGQAEDGAWGKQKYNYYDADDIGTDTDDDDAAAQEEEEEALRLQRKRLEALDEGDFIDEFSAQLGVGAKGADGISRLVSSVEDGSEQAQTQAAPGELGADGSYS